jgi:hypothetical protein
VKRASEALSWLLLALAAYLIVLLARYFYGSDLPRFRVETIFMWFAGVGAIAVFLRKPAPDRLGQFDARASWLSAAWAWPALWAIFAVMALAVHGSALRIGFLSDDFVLADWALRRDWVHTETGFFRPVVPMVWALLSFLPFPLELTLHAANVLLHAVNALLIVSLGRSLGLSRGVAVGAGLLFLTFPAMTEAIVWTSGIQDVLMTSLVLASVVALAGVDDRSSLGPLAVAAGIVALGVKETAIAAPVLGWLVWASLDGDRPRARRTLVIMTGAAVAYAGFRVLAGMPSAYATGIDRYFVKQLLVEPFATLGEPWSTQWMHAHPAIALARGTLLVLLAAAGFWTWSRRDREFRRAAMLAAWVLVGMLPVFSYFHVSAALEGSRYLYLPAAGFSILLAGLIGDAARRLVPRHSAAMAAVTLAALAITSVIALRAETARWSDAARLRDTILASFPLAEPCSTFVTEGAVDNLDGAYVLRNGLREALEKRGLVVPATEDGTRCKVGWTDRLVIEIARP